MSVLNILKEIHKKNSRQSLEDFDLIQTFYVNPDRVGNAASVMLSSIDLYFKAKPDIRKNITGILGPGITVCICEVKNNQPDLNNILANSIVNIDYDMINTSRNGESATVISFQNPVIVSSGSYYGIVIKFQDPAFDIWMNIQGDRLLGINGVTENLSNGALRKALGLLWCRGSTSLFNALTGRDLKFRLNIANFNLNYGTGESGNTGGGGGGGPASTNSTFVFVNKDYEFLTVSSFSKAFIGGEWVYKNTSDEAGTLNINSANLVITGSGTNFTNNHLGMYTVVSNGSITDVLRITGVANSTSLEVDRMPNFSNTAATYKLPPIGKVYYTDYTKKQIILDNSTAANANFKFEANDVIIGQMSQATAVISSLDRYPVDNFTPRFLIGNPATSNFKIQYALTTEANVISSEVKDLQLQEKNLVPYKAYVLSRSQEVIESGLYGDKRKSAFANISFNASLSGANTFTLPFISAEDLDFYMYSYSINDNTKETRYGITEFDTEVERNGLAKSKYISVKIPFAENRAAEDIVVYISAYRPSGTDIKVYAKIHNSADKESFDDKAWSPLELKGNIDKFSGEDTEDFIEYTFGFPQYPEVNMNLSGNFTCAQGNNVVTASVDPSSSVAAGDLVKLSAPLFPENHEVFPVASANSSAIVLSRAVNNINVNGNILVDTLKYKNVAWNNIANDNVCRYVTTSLVEFDTYNTMQIKVVLLANNSNIVPRLDQTQGIGVSA